MSKSILPAHILHCVPTILCFLIAVPASHGDVDERFAVCSRQVDCGTLSLDIGYPFWGDGLRPQYCGRQEFYLDCQNNPNQNPTQSPTIFMGSEAFRVLDIDDGHQTMIITPARLDLLSSYCPSVQWPQAIINHTLFSLQCDITRTMNPVRHVPLLKGYADLMRLQTNLCVFAVINPTCLPPQLVCLLPPHAHPPKYYGGRQSSETQTEACHRNYGPLPLKRYNFSDVKKITNSFKDKLGQGGFGGVYKGKLLDGRSVAVKLLNASKGDG
ncbi:hypothetical protein CUMW_148780 [Citrus unshiu]|nr:hypothetical protein CUMW_148780 [Citrus unshiu]